MKEFAIQKTGFLHAQEAPLYYEVTAPERPISDVPVLFIHAGMTDCRMWDEQFVAFAPDYQVIRYDMRGYGKSAFPSGRFARYEDPSLLLAYLNIPKAHVVAASTGGEVAIDFALTYPDAVASLTLVAPSVDGLDSSKKFTKKVTPIVSQELGLLARGDIAGATELSVRMWVDGPMRSPKEVDPAVRQRVYEMLYQAFGVERPEETEEIRLDPPAYERLSKITVPTLAIVGNLDWPERFRIVSKLTDAMPNIQTMILEGGAHMINMEQPEAFNQIMSEFLLTLFLQTL